MSQGIDSFGCINNTIKVAKGHYFDLANPNPDDVDIFSIASALSKVCRFGGHCPRFYSVAEHLIHCVTVAEKNGINDHSILKAVMLHDAAEAYIGDMVEPLKLMMPSYEEIEKTIEDAISKRFNVDFKAWHGVIKEVDRLMLKCEKTQLWPEDQSQWHGFADIGDVDIRLDYLHPAEASQLFLCVWDLIEFPIERSGV